jgi:hypothetical protein
MNIRIVDRLDLYDSIEENDRIAVTNGRPYINRPLTWFVGTYLGNKNMLLEGKVLTISQFMQRSNHFQVIVLTDVSHDDEPSILARVNRQDNPSVNGFKSFAHNTILKL